MLFSRIRKTAPSIKRLFFSVITSTLSVIPSAAKESPPLRPLYSIACKSSLQEYLKRIWSIDIIHYLWKGTQHHVYTIASVMAKKTVYKHSAAFYLVLALLWLWPAIVVLALFHWSEPMVATRLLYKSTWVLFAGSMQSLFACLASDRPKNTWDPLLFVFIFLLAASLFLLPFGLMKWEWYNIYPDIRIFELSHTADYVDNLTLSMLLHIFPSYLLYELIFGIGVAPEIDLKSNDYPKMNTPSGSGTWGEKTWLDDVWKTDKSPWLYGKHGEFDRNDESRRASEDIQQFHGSHKDADLTDQYFWDDILDADTDGYLDSDD